MSLKDEKIKEITEALKLADDKIVAVVYTLVMLTTEFSEPEINLQEEAKKKEEKPSTSPLKKPAKATKIAEMDFDDDSFDEPLVEEKPKEEPVKKAEVKKPAPVKKAPVEDDFSFDEDFDEDGEFEAVKKPSEVIKETKKAEVSEDFDEFDEEPAKPAKKEEIKPASNDDFDDFDF